MSFILLDQIGCMIKTDIIHLLELSSLLSKYPNPIHTAYQSFLQLIAIHPLANKDKTLLKLVQPNSALFANGK